MSLVAKVFVVLNLLASVAFLIFAANVWTAQTKWQKMYELEKQKSLEILASTQKRQVELSEQVVREQMNVDARKNELIAAKLKLNEVRDSKLQVEAKLAAIENAKDMKEAENQELAREVRRYAEELTKSKGVIIKQQQAVVVERENAIRARNEKSEMENELNVTKQSFAALQRDKHTVESDLGMMTRKFERLLAKGVPVQLLIGDDVQATQPYVSDAQVLAVRSDVGLVMISAGTQQGVKPGFHFTISRGDQYIAKVQVDRVYPDMCSAKIVAGLVKQGEEIQVHDEARSR